MNGSVNLNAVNRELGDDALLRRLDQVEIQIASWCNRTCSFCPSGTFPIPKKPMEMATVGRIIDELETVGFSGVIGLHLMCEPLLHKNLQTIIGRFRERLPGTFIRLESNGDALRKVERLGRLFDSGLNEILINCYDSHAQFVSRCREILALRPAGGPVWLWNRWLRNPPLSKNRWRVVRLRTFYEGGYSLKNWAGHVASQRPDAVVLPLALGCARPFRRLHINYMGQVVLCNMDWKFEVICGDLRTQGIVDVLRSPVLGGYQERLLAADRDMTLCRACDSGAPSGVQPRCPPADALSSLRGRWLDATGHRHWRRLFGNGSAVR